MTTPRQRTERRSADAASVAEAVALLQRGEVVAFPTDTVYGLGASVERLDAVEALYRLKGRPDDKHFALLVGSIAQAQRYARSWPAAAAKLAEVFWPGPLTMVVPRTAALAAVVVAGGDTVALRVPGHAVARALAQQLGTAIAAPSANLSGLPPPRDASAVLQQLGGRIPLVLDGGPSRHGKASTIVAFDGDGVAVVLREGAVSREALARHLPVRAGAGGEGEPPSQKPPSQKPPSQKPPSQKM